jgi:non-canonical (house-cleaning) NTP pyrophosphatase
MSRIKRVMRSKKQKRLKRKLSKEKVKKMTTIYLTSKNPVKYDVATTLITQNTKQLNIDAITCVESESGIEGGQPYGLEETKQGCINRTKQFKNRENFISIENGFVRHSPDIWYDIAFIYIRLNNTIYSGLSSKREFPSNLYNNTDELVKHFEKNSITRHKQLSDCLNEIISKIKYNIC